MMADIMDGKLKVLLSWESGSTSYVPHTSRDGHIALLAISSNSVLPAKHLLWRDASVVLLLPLLAIIWSS